MRGRLERLAREDDQISVPPHLDTPDPVVNVEHPGGVAGDRAKRLVLVHAVPHGIGRMQRQIRRSGSRARMERHPQPVLRQELGIVDRPALVILQHLRADRHLGAMVLQFLQDSETIVTPQNDDVEVVFIPEDLQRVANLIGPPGVHQRRHPTVKQGAERLQIGVPSGTLRFLQLLVLAGTGLAMLILAMLALVLVPFLRILLRAFQQVAGLPDPSRSLVVPEHRELHGGLLPDNHLPDVVPGGLEQGGRAAEQAARLRGQEDRSDTMAHGLAERLIVWRDGIGHADRVPSIGVGCRGCGMGVRHRGLALPVQAEMGVDVDQARHDKTGTGIDDLRSGRNVFRRPHIGNLRTADENQTVVHPPLARRQNPARLDRQTRPFRRLLGGLGRSHVDRPAIDDGPVDNRIDAKRPARQNHQIGIFALLNRTDPAGYAQHLGGHDRDRAQGPLARQAVGDRLGGDERQIAGSIVRRRGDGHLDAGVIQQRRGGRVDAPQHDVTSVVPRLALPGSHESVENDRRPAVLDQVQDLTGLRRALENQIELEFLGQGDGAADVPHRVAVDADGEPAPQHLNQHPRPRIEFLRIPAAVPSCLGEDLAQHGHLGHSRGGELLLFRQQRMVRVRREGRIEEPGRVLGRFPERDAQRRRVIEAPVGNRGARELDDCSQAADQPSRAGRHVHRRHAPGQQPPLLVVVVEGIARLDIRRDRFLIIRLSGQCRERVDESRNHDLVRCVDDFRVVGDGNALSDRINPAVADDDNAIRDRLDRDRDDRPGLDRKDGLLPRGITRNGCRTEEHHHKDPDGPSIPVISSDCSHGLSSPSR
jgi:hypothetical protein